MKGFIYYFWKEQKYVSYVLKVGVGLFVTFVISLRSNLVMGSSPKRVYDKQYLFNYYTLHRVHREQRRFIHCLFASK